MKTIYGIGVGPGRAWGRVFILENQHHEPTGKKSSRDVAEEFARLQSGMTLAYSALENLAKSSEAETKDIFAALMLVLEDPELMTEAKSNLDLGWNAETALSKAMESFSSALAGIEGFEERISDLEGLVSLVANKLNEASQKALPNDGPIIVVAENLTPMDMMQFNESVVGVITKAGGPTSHAAIICRQLGIPALVAVKEGFELLSQNLGVRIDALTSEAEITEVGDTLGCDLPLFFLEDCLIPVMANIGSTTDALAANKADASGVGLFRTEFLFLGRSEEPSIAEQQEEYRKIFLASPEGQLVVRTLDLSLDKPIPFLNTNETVLIQNQEMLLRQLEAIKNAADSASREVSVMAPMVRSIADAEKFSRLARQTGFTNVGVMVETVEITEVVSQLSGLVDFLSIGTNDLSSELFEQERINPQEPKLLDPWQPKLLQTIASVVSDAKAAGIRVSVCGEAASDPNLAVVLAGLGVDTVSVGSGSIRQVGQRLAGVLAEQASEGASIALEATSAEQAKRAVATFMQGIEG